MNSKKVDHEARALAWSRNQFVVDSWTHLPGPTRFSIESGEPVDIVEGLDLNRFQRGEVLDPAAIYESGRRFIIIEATWGLWVPPSFSEFWPPLLDAGFILFAYGFFCGDLSGEEQADLLLNTIAPMYNAQGFWAPLFSDVERFVGDESNVIERTGNWRDWTGRIRQVCRPGVYSNIPSWNVLMENEPIPDDCISWAAHHSGTVTPLLPPGWRREFHQYGIATKYPWSPRVPGMASDVDVDRAYMTLDRLRALAQNVQVPPEEPPMSTILEDVAQAKVLAAQLEVLLDQIEQKASEEVPPPPPPPPSTDISIRITRDGQANAFYSTVRDGVGKPIMRIYPSDSSPASERIQFAEGSVLRALPDKVVASGGGRFFQLTQHQSPRGDVLYISDNHASRV